jgi:hypothetical protein
MTQETLLTQPKTQVQLIAGKFPVPRLATCQYQAYRRSTGTAVRVTRSAPRWIRLPDPRYTDQPAWPSAMLLAPGKDIFRKGLPSDVFAARYLEQLDQTEFTTLAGAVLLGVEAVAAQLSQVPVEDGRLVLLCFESEADITADPLCCHRRVFASWWQDRTGAEVPELVTS